MEINNYKLFKRTKFKDERGFLSEIYKKREFDDLIKEKITFVQDNFVLSKKNVIRGLHYQVKPRSQGKYISVLEGEIFDVIVDLRMKSENFGKWYGFNLSSLNCNSLWVPKGFAHGFLTLSERSLVSYKLTDFYNSNADRSIKWDSRKLDIKWPNKSNIILSDKDRSAQEFDERKSYE